MAGVYGRVEDKVERQSLIRRQSDSAELSCGGPHTYAMIPLEPRGVKGQSTGSTKRLISLSEWETRVGEEGEIRRRAPFMTCGVERFMGQELDRCARVSGYLLL